MFFIPLIGLVIDHFKGQESQPETPAPETTPDTQPDLPDSASKDELKRSTFFKSYTQKSKEIFGNLAKPVPPIGGNRTKREAVDLLQLGDYDFPEWDASKTLTDAEGLQMLKHFSVFNGSTNVVQKNADKYFMDNIFDNCDANGDLLPLLGITKPVIPEKRKSIGDKPLIRIWYHYYSYGYIPLMYSQCGFASSSKIDVDRCNYFLRRMESDAILDHTFSHQRMLLFKYAYCEKNQWMNKLQMNPERWIKIYAEHLKSKEFLIPWAKTMNSRTTEQFNAYLVNLKATLDILDPTGVTSRNILNILVSAALFERMGPGSIKDTSLNREIIKGAIQSFLEYIQNTTEIDQDKISIVKDLIETCGGTAGAVKEIQNSIIKVLIKESGYVPMQDDNYSSYFDGLGRKIALSMENSALKADKYMKFFGGLSKFIQFLVIIYCGSQYGKLDTYNKAFFTASILNIGLDIASSIFKVSEAFRALGATIGDVLAKIPSANLSPLASTVFTNDLATFVGQRFSPALMAVAAIKSVYDGVQDAEADNLGALVIDGFSASLGLATAIAIFGGCACAGPLALVVGAALLALAVVKYKFFTPTADETYFDKFVNKDFKKV